MGDPSGTASTRAVGWQRSRTCTRSSGGSTLGRSVHCRSGCCVVRIAEPIVLEADPERWDVHWTAHLRLSVFRGLRGRCERGEFREKEGVGLRWHIADDLHNRRHHSYPRSWSQEPRHGRRALRLLLHERRCPCRAHQHASCKGMNEQLGHRAEALPCTCFPNSWLRACTMSFPDRSFELTNLLTGQIYAGNSHHTRFSLSNMGTLLLSIMM